MRGGSPNLRLQSLVLAVTVAAGAHACVGIANPVARITTPIPPPAIVLPLTAGSVRFAVIGDTGTGDFAQRLVARQLTAAHAAFPFGFVLMTGDNLYGSEERADYREKFEEPYKALLDAGVKFYASLGNHDETTQIYYEPFNMGKKRFYTFKPQDGVRFFALDSNHMNPEQLEWLEGALQDSRSEWKIAFFHHPLYSTGASHGPDLILREQLEPIFVKYGVNAVFSGHEHFYERLRPQKGVQYFISGGGGKLSEGDIQGGSIHAKGFDSGYHFMLIEITGNAMQFQVISGRGNTVDSGRITRSPDPARAEGQLR